MEDANQKYFRPDTAVSLGCNEGALIVDFQSTGGTDYAGIVNGQEIWITELGRYCDSEDFSEVGSDVYTASVCETQVGADATMIAIDTDCTYSLSVEGSTDLQGLATPTVEGLPEAPAEEEEEEEGGEEEEGS